MAKFLNSQGILLKNFGTYVEDLSERIKEHARELAEKTGRPMQYVSSSKIEARYCDGWELPHAMELGQDTSAS
jgi:hypothetical protein